jgi:hypothetical protein
MAGGINPTGPRVGLSASSRTAQTARSIGATMFEVGVTGGQIAAGAFGGPAAAAGVGALRQIGSAIGGSGGGFGGSTGGSGTFQQSADVNASVADAINQRTNSTLEEQAKVQEAGFSQQMALFRLQQAVNRDSEQFQALTNIQKKKDETFSSAIQNIR